MRTTVLVSLLLVAALARPGLRAEEGPSPGDVKKAIDAATGWLRKEFAGGFVDETDHDAVELVVLTMTHAGLNMQDKTYAQGVALLEKVNPRFTYRTALLAMALAEINPRLYQWRLAHCAQWLVDTQLAGGEWGYPGTVSGPGSMPGGITVAPPPAAEGEAEGSKAPRAKVVIQRRSSQTSDVTLKGDFSNTQFAILGLRACRDAGVEVPKDTWKRALDYLRKYQHDHGGWGYVIQGEQDEGSYASLTCAGICSLAICLSALGTKDVRADSGIKKALGWLDKNLDPSRNAGIENSSVRGPSAWQYYHLYSLERAGRVLGVETLGKRPWYAQGAKWLLGAQQGDGRWEDSEGSMGSRRSYMTQADTCFAILFLARATRPITGS
jgi:hypothetical protein